MFGRKVQKGLDITRESWQVLRQDRELLLFPVFSAIAGLAILATITSAGLLIPELGRWLMKILQDRQPETLGEQALGVGCLFVLSVRAVLRAVVCGGLFQYGPGRLCLDSILRRRSHCQRWFSDCNPAVAPDFRLDIVCLGSRYAAFSN